MPHLPKDSYLMDRVSGRSILYTMLRESKGEPVSMKSYYKEVKANGRTVTAFPRVLYWVGKEVENYGWDIETTSNSDGEITSVKLVKRGKDAEPSEGAKRPPSYGSKKKKVKKTKKASKKSKPSSKKVSKKKSKKEESESDEVEESSEEESSPDESEEEES